MRHIKMDIDLLDAGWLEKAKNHTLEVAKLSIISEKRKYIDENNIWIKVKDHLSRLSNGKCWYCETLIIRSYSDVDHFRPKKEIKGISHDGYWWLAYSPHNYRLSCNYCNRTHKRTHFPVKNNAHAMAPEPIENTPDLLNVLNKSIEKEEHILLDPTKIHDTQQIDISGNDARIIPIKTSTAPDRVKQTCKILGLNVGNILQFRRKIYQEVGEYIRHIQYALGQLFVNVTPEKIRIIKMILKQNAELLLDKTSEASEYQTTAIRSFQHHVKNNERIKMLLKAVFKKYFNKKITLTEEPASYCNKIQQILVRM